ncbi:hypothetical protein DN051_32275 [Streptomyces cadmiisoli]|uniref:Uncharacterized protein n=1 Tax=Streptomyces cadmiisoli TaxID=2184053 RepID=A0A2Z4J785_9ACTN|nr:hypothetical protein DN051_32275 [Streptomyces cadmiisoli]
MLFPRQSHSCEEGATDVITVAESTYDHDSVYVTASEHNGAGVMTHHIGFFLAPREAVAFGFRLMREGLSKMHSERVS